jgi:hypothetical protein
MPRILFNPGLLECPDFTSDTFVISRAPFINANTTEQQAIQLLRDIWTAGNDADKVRWQLQLDEDEAALAERHLQMQSDNLVAQTEVEEAEAARKDELKKNKSKYLPILDRDVPSISPVIAWLGRWTKAYMLSYGTTPTQVWTKLFITPIWSMTKPW